MDIKQIADQVGQLFNDNTLLLEEMLNNLFYIAASDGHISVNEIDLLKSIFSIVSLLMKKNISKNIFKTHLKDSAL